MKKCILLFIVSFLFTAAYSQMSKINYSLAVKMANEANANREVGLFVKGDIAEIRSITEHLGGYFKYAAGDIAAVQLRIADVMPLASSAKIEAIEDSYMKLQPMCDSMVSKNGILPVKLGTAPLPQSYDGSGVVMGIIDSGIDFTHPDFKDASGNTRVKYIWDHNLTGGVTPQPYNYGREFTSADIDGGLATAHVDNDFGHGTHVTGVAAGNGRALNYFAGAAPNTDIITVCVNWNLTDDDWLTSVADAVNYIFTKANALGEPAVINISAGTYFGSHDAKDLQAQAINNLITQQNGRTLVCAAGNAGDLAIHMQYNSTVGTDTSFTWFLGGASTYYMEMWADVANFSQVRFSVGADVISPNYEFRGAIPFTGVSSHLGVLKTDTLYSLSGNRLALVQSYAYSSSGRYSMVFNVIPDSISYYPYRLSFTGIGKFDLWSFQMMNSTSGLPTPAVYPPMAYYNFPDLTQNIVSSFTCSDKVITVAEYVNKVAYTDCQGLPETITGTADSLSVHSSHGPTRIGLSKPDIASAGGVTMAAAVLAFNPPTNKMAEGCMHIRDGGTSTASPGVAGVAALYLQRYPTANWLTVKNAILYCNKRDQFTGLTGFPKNDWGFGKVNGFAALTGCAALGIENPAVSNESFLIYPNPVMDEAVINLNLTAGIQKYSLVICDMLGNKVREYNPDTKSHQIHLKKAGLTDGVYIVRLMVADKILKAEKLVIL